jgi:hypothetical protein
VRDEVVDVWRVLHTCRGIGRSRGRIANLQYLDIAFWAVPTEGRLSVALT